MMKHCYTRILLSLVFLLSSLHVSALSLKAEETEVPEDYTLQEVVVLSRHNIRAPLSTAGSAEASCRSETSQSKPIRNTTRWIRYLPRS